MSLLEKNKNNSGIKQLNQISEYTLNSSNNNNITNRESYSKKSESEEEEEEEEEEENENDDEEHNILNEEKDNIEKSNEEDEEEEIDEENLSLLSLYKYRLNYDEKIYIYPRPKTSYSLFYKNKNNENIFISSSDNIDNIPSVKSFYKNIEEYNSYAKLIRPSQYILPNKINTFKETLNLFGINVEPFSLEDKENSIEFIQKIFLKNKNINLFRCFNCNAVYHKSIFNFENNKYLCYICKKTKEFIKDNYVIPDTLNINNKPSIEYIIENENKINRIIIQIIIIDLMNKDLAIYICQMMNEILSKKSYDDDNIKYMLIAYDREKIYFFNYNISNNNINIIIMKDLKDPFCPLEPYMLLYNNKTFLDFLDIFYNSFLLKKIDEKNENILVGNPEINNGIIKSIFCLIKLNKNNINNINNNKLYFHLIFFSSYNHNINTSLLQDNKNKINNNNIFISFFLITNKKNNKNIPFIDSMNIHYIKLYDFPIDYSDKTDIHQKYQKIRIISEKILNIKNYIFDINIMLCYDKKLFYNEFNNDIINISFFPNKKYLNKLYIIPQIGNPSILSTIYIQFIIEYHISLNTDIKHIRILNLMNKVSKEEKDVYKSIDEEILFRLNLALSIKKLKLEKNNFNSINKLYMDIINKNDYKFAKIIREIINKIKKTYAQNYKYSYSKKGIYISFSNKLISLYLFSFIKQISLGHNLNLLNLLYDCKITTFMKNVYPGLIKLGFKLKSQEEIFRIKPLSMEFLFRNEILLLDDGIYTSLLINNDVKKSTKDHYLIYDDIKKEFDMKINDENIKELIKDKPMKSIILEDDVILSKKILDIFLEDKNIENINNGVENEQKFEINNEYIQNDISYPDFYCIISDTFFEFFE